MTHSLASVSAAKSTFALPEENHEEAFGFDDIGGFDDWNGRLLQRKAPVCTHASATAARALQSLRDRRTDDGNERSDHSPG